MCPMYVLGQILPLVFVKAKYNIIKHSKVEVF